MADRTSIVSAGGTNSGTSWTTITGSWNDVLNNDRFGAGVGAIAANSTHFIKVDGFRSLDTGCNPINVSASGSRTVVEANTNPWNALTTTPPGNLTAYDGCDMGTFDVFGFYGATESVLIRNLVLRTSVVNATSIIARTTDAKPIEFENVIFVCTGAGAQFPIQFWQGVKTRNCFIIFTNAGVTACNAFTFSCAGTAQTHDHLTVVCAAGIGTLTSAPDGTLPVIRNSYVHMGATPFSNNALGAGSVGNASSGTGTPNGGLDSVPFSTANFTSVTGALDLRPVSSSVLKTTGAPRLATLLVDAYGQSRSDPATIGAAEPAAVPAVITGPTGAPGAPSITHTVNELQNAAGTWTVANPVGNSTLTGTDAALLAVSGGATTVVTKLSGNFDFETKASYSFNVVNGGVPQAVTLNLTNLPELQTPTKSTPTSTTAVIGATVDAATGTLYGVLTLDNNPPSVAQVKAGQDAAGSGATTVVPASLTISSAGAKSFAPAAVVSGTTRYGWMCFTSGGVDSTVLATGALYPGTGRPVSDVSVAGWTASSGGVMAAMLDEDAPGSDADYITSPALSGSASNASMDLDKTYGAGTYNIKVRASVDAGVGNLVVRMLNGSDVSQGVTANQALNTTPTTYTLPITTTGDATRIRVEVTT